MYIDPATQTRLFLGLYELELNRYLRRLVTRGSVAFDVGGQHGYDALVIAKLTRAQVTSFECVPANIFSMERNFALNPALQPVLTAIHATVGTGENTLSLDDYAYSPTGFLPDFMKIDIEGAEVEALRGARQILADARPSVIVETHSAHAEDKCGALLAHHGYRPVIVNQRRVLSDYRPGIEHNRWLVASRPG
jgi:Methyltransferase FkbM domain